MGAKQESCRLLEQSCKALSAVKSLALGGTSTALRHCQRSWMSRQCQCPPALGLGDHL